MLILVIVLLLLLCFGWGSYHTWYGSNRYGYGIGWGPLGLIVVLLLFLLLTGQLH